MRARLCDFEDLDRLDDETLRLVLEEADFRDLVLALQTAEGDLRGRVYSLLAGELAEALRRDIAHHHGASWESVKAAQKRVRNVLRTRVSARNDAGTGRWLPR